MQNSSMDSTEMLLMHSKVSRLELASSLASLVWAEKQTFRIDEFTVCSLLNLQKLHLPQKHTWCSEIIFQSLKVLLGAPQRVLFCCVFYDCHFALRQGNEALQSICGKEQKSLHKLGMWEIWILLLAVSLTCWPVLNESDETSVPVPCPTSSVSNFSRQ